MINSAYPQLILDLYRNPLNKKKMEEFDLEQHEHNPLCGDDISVRLKFGPDDRLEDVGHYGIGCAISQAGASLYTEEIKGKTKEEISKMTEDEAIRMLGIEISYSRKKCATLAWKAIANALKKK